MHFAEGGTLRATRSAAIGALAMLGAACLALLVYATVLATGSPLPPASKVTPFSLTVYSASSLPPEVQAQEAATAPNLFDRDTTTQHVAYDVSSVQATFESAQSVAAIKVYGPAPYLLTVKADAGGSFQTIAGLENINLTLQPAAWNSFSAAAPVTTTKLLLTLTPASGSSATGINELEIWTSAAPVTVASGAALLNQVLGPTPPPQGRAYLGANSTATPNTAVVTPNDSSKTIAANTFNFTVDRDPALFVRAYLTYELYGQASFISVRRNINDAQPNNSITGGSLVLPTTTWTTQVERINPAWLVRGANTVQFTVLSSSTSDAGYTVRNVRLVGELDTGANAVETIVANQPDSLVNAVGALYDGDLTTGWRPYPDQAIDAVSPVIEASLRRPTQLDGVSLHVSAPLSVVLSVRQAGVWSDFPDNIPLDIGWNTINVPPMVPLASRVYDGVRLTFSGGGSSSAEVHELLFVGSGVGGRTAPAKMFLTYPDAGQFYGRQGWVQGFVEPVNNGSGNASITVGGTGTVQLGATIGNLRFKDNVGFAAQADNDAWSMEVKAVYPNGETVSTTVFFNQQMAQAQPATGTLAGSVSATVSAKLKKTVSNDESVLTFPAGSVAADTTVTIQPLADGDVPALDVGMTNVTKGPRRGYRYLPHGAKFLQNVSVAMPYDRALIPPGHTEDDVKTFYFDDQAGRWVELDRVSVDKTNKLVNSNTNHFTDMINAVVTVPDHPQTVSFNPTSMKDIKAADPGAQINLIEPPKANNMGDARLSYPIEVPPGRQGIQPQFAVSYTSSGANGWMGLGWSMAQREITIETRWGVPRYDDTRETETYVLEGEMLTPVAHRGDLQPRNAAGDKVFHTRVEGQFRKIVRHGNSPSTYWWEVTDKNGVRSIYGGDLSTNAVDPNAVLRSDKAGAIYRWALREVRDLNGNRMTYTYDTVNDAGVDNSTVFGRQLYLRQCFYTGDGSGPGRYTVTFVRDSGIAPDRRPDVQIDARGGFKQVTANLLKRIDVRFDSQTIRSYAFEYQEGAFKKTLLKSISQYGTDGRLFNTHSFSYYDDIRNPDGTYKGFGAPMVVNTGTDNIVYSTVGGTFPHTVLGGTDGSSAGLDGYVGVGTGGTKNISVGVGFGASRARSHGNNALVDVDGDGLPDKVFLPGLYRRNLSAPGALDSIGFMTSNAAQPVGGYARPSETESSTSNISVQAFVVGVTANAGTATTNTRDKSYLADVNGDGLVDIVSGGGVLFNTAKNTGVPGFSANSFDSSVPLGNVGGSVDKNIFPDVSADKARLEAENPLMDNVRRWVAPYDGVVRVTGAVRLVDLANDPRLTPDEREARAAYKLADGVRVAIQKNGAELWNDRILATDFGEHSPTGVDAVSVVKGDRIYFRVGSVNDGAYDQVAWSPTVEYTAGGSVQSGIDQNNLVTAHYQAGEDSVYAGRPVEMMVPYRGTVRLSGILNKTAVTSDDITLRVTVADRTFADDGTLISETIRVPVQRKIAWDFIGAVSLQEDFAVTKYAGVKIDLLIDSQVDLTKLKWGDLASTATPRPGLPRLYYTQAFQDEENPLAPPTIDTTGDVPTNAEQIRPNGKAGLAPIPDENGVPITIPARELETVDANGNPTLVMTLKYDADIYSQNRLSSPQVAWVAPRDGFILWTPWIKLKDGSTQTPPTTITVPDGTVTMTAKHRGNRLAKQVIQIQGSAVVQSTQGYYGVQVFRVSAGDEVFFDASTRDPAIEAALDTTQVYISYASETAFQVPVTDSVDLLARLSGTGPAPDPSVTAERRALYVVRRNDGEILASQIVDFAATPTVDLAFTRSVVQGDRLYFDVITVNPAVSVSSAQASARYTSNASYTATVNGQVSVTPLLNFRTGAPDGSVTLTVLRNGAAVAQQAYTVTAGIASGPAIAVDVNPNQVLTFAYTTADFQMAGFLADKGAVTVDDGTTQTSVGAASFTITMPAPQFALQSPQDAQHYFPLNDPLFGNPYRGWATAAYNGNGARSTVAISETLFALSSNPDDYKSSATQHNAWLAMPAPEKERWDSVDDGWWTAPLEVSASRKGIDSIYDPKADDFTDPRSPGFAGASRPPKMGKATQKVFGAGFYLSFTQSSGKSESQLDVLDMNGDRFPDVVGPGGTQYTWADGTFFDTYGGTNARHGEDEQSTLGLSVGVPISRAGAKGVVLGGGDRDNGEKSSINVGASVNKGSNKTNDDLIDVNGDGLPDRVSPAGGGLSVAINTGYGFAPAEIWTPGDLTKGTSRGQSFSLGFSTWNGTVGGGISVSENHNYTDTQLMDINGDGLADVIFAGPGRLSVFLNTGSGFVPIDWPGALTPYKDFRSRAAGRPAVADGGSSTTSGSIKYAFSFTIFGISVSFSIGINASQTASQPSIQYTDLNGDGFADAVLTADDASMTVALNPIKRTNLLKTVNRPMGARIDLDYERVGNTFNMPQSRFVLSRVNVFDGVPGNGPDNQVTTYRYENGVFDRFERDFYGFGRVTEEHRDTAANELLYRSTVREYLNDSYYRKGLMKRELLQDAQGRPFTETENTYRLRDVGTGTAPADPASVAATIFPEMIRADRRFYEGQLSPGKTTFTTNEYDALGNVIRFTDDGEPLQPTDDLEATITYTSCPTYVIKPNHITVRGNGAIMRERDALINCATGDVTQVQQFVGNGQVATTNLAYFPNGNIQNVTGPANAAGQRYVLTYEYDPDVATHVARITDSFGLSSQATHDPLFGKVKTTTDTSNNQTTNFYDVFGRITSIVGPYEQNEGTPTLSFEFHPEATVPWAITRHVDKDADGRYKSSDTIDTILFADGLKRVIQTKKDATVLEPPATAAQDVMTVSGQVTFDAFGRTVAQRYPRTETKASETVNGRFNTDVDPVAPSTTEYDVLDRITKTTIPDGTFTTSAYGFGVDRANATQFETVVTDANVNAGRPGAVKRTYRNVRELTTSVRQLNKSGSEVIWTSYAYDALSQIVQVLDNLSNTTNVSYDNLGRRTVIDNPDAGKTETQYDTASNITAKITANLRAQSKAITYAYDFNRLAAITYPNFPGNNVSYTYGAPGAAGNAAGRISRIASQMGIEERQYGKLGETVYEKKTVNTFTDPLHPSVFETRLLFETFGRLLRITYPDGEVVTNTYDSGGNLTKAVGVKRVDNQGQNHTYTYLRELLYDKFEQRAQVTQGNGVTTVYTYNAQTQRLSNLNAVRQGNAIFQNLSYSYDKVGNILSLANNVAVPPPNVYGGPTSHSFVYDDLYRMTHAQGTFQYAPDKTHTYNLDLAYDTIHNITRKNQLHTIVQPSQVAITQKKTTYDFPYAYNLPGTTSARPHAPNHIGQRAFSYDANGNQTGWTHDANGTRRNIVWDDENRIQAVFDNGHEKDYKYDDKGTRVIKRGPQGETVYVNQFYTQRPGATGTKHVYAGTTRIASKLLRQDVPNANPNGNTPFEKDIYFFHPDHIGSTNYVTDLNGKLYEHLEYFPFGESWVEENSNTQRTPYLFSAKELDEETGLYYFGVRYYDPRTSVWQSADPILDKYLHGEPSGGVFEPANLGLYSYVHHRPVVLHDPNGEFGIVGALVGAVAGVAVQGAIDLYKGEVSSVGAYVGAAAGGALIGATAGLGAAAVAATGATGAAATAVTTGVAVAAGAAGGATATVTEGLVDGKAVTGGDVARGAAYGAAGGLVGAAAGKVVSTVVERASPAIKGAIGELATEARYAGQGYVSGGKAVVQTGARTATGRAAAAHYDHAMKNVFTGATRTVESKFGGARLTPNQAAAQPRVSTPGGLIVDRTTAAEVGDAARAVVGSGAAAGGGVE